MLYKQYKVVQTIPCCTHTNREGEREGWKEGEGEKERERKLSVILF